MEGPIDVFISYVPEDGSLREELEKHLALLKRDGVIRAWHQRLIGAGSDFRAVTGERLRSARVVVLLVSADYLASDLYDEEMQPALARSREGKPLVLPVLARAHDSARAPFSGLTPLPSNKLPVTSWPNRDEAWTDVASGIREAIERLGGTQNARPAEKTQAPEPRYEDSASRALAKELEQARARRKALLEAKQPTAAVDAEILDLRRRLREGGRLRAGDTLEDGRYLLLAPIGRGGFASVWSALDREAGEHVAIKVLHAEMARDESRRERFFRGARVMASLGHEAVVRVRSPQGDDGGWLYFVMELVRGGDLRRAVVDGNVTREQAIRIVLAVGEALAEAHARGIVHRDVKPANILLDPSGAPRLTDFDLVAVGDTTGGTRTGAAMGTFLFMAPEQSNNAKSADARADVYGLGMTAMFCLHRGELPEFTLRRPDKVIEGLSCASAVKAVLTKAIELDPNERFANARVFCEALHAAAYALPDLDRIGADMHDAARRLLGSAAPLAAPAQDPASRRIEMVLIPGGTFWVGSKAGDPGADGDEQPRHEVRLSPYWMGKVPVTQKLYREVTGQNPRSFAGDDLPINQVSWVDAVQFCNRLSVLEGFAPAYHHKQEQGEWVWDRVANGYRLPTEAEWEYAARGTDGRAYPWGNEPPTKQLCWNGEGNDLGKSKRRGPSPVGSYPAGASPFGLLDMSGNVWEWCWDWYGAYDASHAHDPLGASAGTRRVLRGGAWNSDVPSWVRAANRGRHDFAVRYIGVGFRCARGPK